MNAKKILVIEDNEMNMKLMKAVLEQGQYEVLEARDAETGLAMAGANPPDLILMDIQLPGMDGFFATQIIKADERLKTIPVYAVTGFAMEADIQRASKVGFDGYIVKPFRVKELLDTLARQFAREPQP